MSGEIIERTVAATVKEIESSPWAGRPAKTIFFGGGTPTFLAEEQLLRIFQAVLKITLKENGKLSVPAVTVKTEVG